jgi:putative glutamine amidotransferase
MTIIGITTFRDSEPGELAKTHLNNAYVRAIVRAGGVPLLIPIGILTDSFDELLEHVDGFLFTGGGDVNPAAYGKDMHPSIRGVDDARDELEFALVKHIIARQKPLLGICRGFQLTNIALGGSLYTHLADQYPGALSHARYPGLPRNLIAHTVEVEVHSRIADILDTTSIGVNSLHHQGIDRLGEGLKPVAYAPDHLIEGWELESHPFAVGVQWHPEAIAESPQMLSLFKALVRSSHSKR